MDAIESDEALGTADADLPDAPIEQPETDLYLPGTPTVSFLEYVDLAVRTLFR